MLSTDPEKVTEQRHTDVCFMAHCTDPLMSCSHAVFQITRVAYTTHFLLEYG